MQPTYIGSVASFFSYVNPEKIQTKARRVIVATSHTTSVGVVYVYHSLAKGNSQEPT